MIGKYILLAGVLMNCAYLITKRFVRNIPSWLSITIPLVACAAMITGIVLMRR